MPRASGRAHTSDPPATAAHVDRPGCSLPDRRVALRDSRRPGGAILLYPPAEWNAILKGAEDGEFDLG
ncbi:MAG: DUF397 domain-containing protein [Solirubrobacteraceae bacterium]